MKHLETQKNLSGQAWTTQRHQGEAEQRKVGRQGLQGGGGAGFAIVNGSKVLKSFTKSRPDPRDRGYLLALRISTTREIGIVPKIKAESTEIAQGHIVSTQQSRDSSL